MSSNIKRHSTYPYLSFSFLDDDGNTVDCTHYLVRLVSKDINNEIVINAIIGEVNSGAVWIDESAGIGEYQWQDGDTDEVGRYKYEFKFTKLDGKIFTLPEKDFFEYLVYEDIPTE